MTLDSAIFDIDLEYIRGKLMSFTTLLVKKTLLPNPVYVINQNILGGEKNGAFRDNMYRLDLSVPEVALEIKKEYPGAFKPELPLELPVELTLAS